MNQNQLHTPGPWHINDGKGCRWIETSADDIIARVYKDACSKERFEANSRLIQHAPELLDACLYINSLDPHESPTGEWNEAFKKVAAAIAKATGANHE